MTRRRGGAFATGVVVAGVALLAASAAGVRRPRLSSAERVEAPAPLSPTPDSPQGAGPAPVPVERPSAPATAAASAPLDEAALMARIRLAEETDPARALELAREGNRHFPEGSNAAERAAVVVKSLARQGYWSEARGEAETMVNRYPGTPWALEVEQHTGAHPRERRLEP